MFSDPAEVDQASACGLAAPVDQLFSTTGTYSFLCCLCVVVDISSPSSSCDPERRVRLTEGYGLLPGKASAPQAIALRLQRNSNVSGNFLKMEKCNPYHHNTTCILFITLSRFQHISESNHKGFHCSFMLLVHLTQTVFGRGQSPCANLLWSPWHRAKRRPVESLIWNLSTQCLSGMKD